MGNPVHLSPCCPLGSIPCSTAAAVIARSLRLPQSNSSPGPATQHPIRTQTIDADAARRGGGNDLPFVEIVGQPGDDMQAGATHRRDSGIWQLQALTDALSCLAQLGSWAWPR